jgi:hypothetical protein
VDLYLHFPIRLHGIVLPYLSTGTDLHWGWGLQSRRVPEEVDMNFAEFPKHRNRMTLRTATQACT